uniref:Uncharacterized protein n=1 Tax=Acrobeloides nanus TaxID=290746 RepID=A0A914CX63_9BILA
MVGMGWLFSHLWTWILCERDAPLPGAVLPSEDELGLTSESSVRESGPLQDDVATNSKEVTKSELIERARQRANYTTTSARNFDRSFARDVLKLPEQRLEVAQTVGGNNRPLQATIRGDELSASATLGCVGPEVDRKQCDAGPCCGWTQWAKWAACNAACGTGSRVRTRVCSSGGSGNEFSRSSSFESNFERSHFTSSVGQSNFAGVRPISPIVSNIVPPIIPSSQVGSRCECDGQPVETEVCEAPECVLPPEPLEACTWSTWGPWCGCAGNCQTGIQARTRYCIHEDFSGGRSRARLRDCDCLGEKVQTQDCRPQHCTSKRQQAFEELDDEPVPSSDEVSSKELEDDPQSCYWSNWSSMAHK